MSQGLDLRDIEIVVQWRYTQSLCTLWQCLGRAVWNPGMEATGIYMVELQYMDQHHKQADKRASERTGPAKQKQAQGAVDPDGLSCKRVHSQDEVAGHGGWKKSRSCVV
jgi:hypothetical protein